MTDLALHAQIETARGRKVRGYKRWFVWCEKRRVLQIGCCASFVSLFLIGFSRFYWQSMIARVLWGLFNSFESSPSFLSFPI